MSAAIEMVMLLDNDARLRKLCLLKDNEQGYSRAALSRFTREVVKDTLSKIIDEKDTKLLKANQAKEVDIVLAASFIKVWSI